MPRHHDENQLAARILWEATNTTPEPTRTAQERAESASRARGTAKYMASLSDDEKSAQGKLGAAARWGDDQPVTADNLGMVTRPKNLDQSQLAKRILDEATGEEPKTPAPTAPHKNKAAVALGKIGGKRGGAARAASLTPEQRSEIARKAAAGRWGPKREG